MACSGTFLRHRHAIDAKFDKVRSLSPTEPGRLMSTQAKPSGSNNRRASDAAPRADRGTFSPNSLAAESLAE